MSQLRGGTGCSNSGLLSITSNVAYTTDVDRVDFANSADLFIDGSVTISEANLIYKLIPDNYDDLNPNIPVGRSLGNTTHRWDGFFSDIDVANDAVIAGDLFVNGGITTLNLDVSGNVVFEDIFVSGVAQFANLEVQNLTTNSVGLVGSEGVVDSTVPTQIDTFDKTVSKGFKYIIHGSNDDGSSAYAIEINCSHNGTDVFFTRFGEVSNSFDCVMVPQINGPNVELVATCSSASTANVHFFNILKIETR